MQSFVPGGSLVVNSSSERIQFATRYGRAINYLNTKIISGMENQQFSGICVDPGDGSLWSVNDTSGQSRIWNYTKAGNLLHTYPGIVISPDMTELEGVTVSPRDYTLYFVDDSPEGAIESRLWHCDRNCVPLEPFVDLTPYGINSAQEIEYDRFSDTLLIISNLSRSLYRLDLDGSLIETIDLSGISPQPNSWQGIAVDLDTGDWWLSGYHPSQPNALIRVDPATLAVRSSIDTSSFPSMGSIAGIAYDPRFDKQ